MGKNRSLNWVRIMQIVLSAIILFVCSFQIGEVLAKYITVHKQNASSQANPYHFSSNYLTKNGSSYNVIKTGTGIEIELYNYETANSGLVSSYDIEYKITISEGWAYELRDAQGQIIPQTETYSLKVLENNELNKHKLYVYSNSNQTSLTVQVSTVSPFKESLSATFNVVSNEVVNYTITDNGEYVVLKIETNSYSGSVTINWSSTNLVPDNTNEIMREWQNSSPSESISVQQNSTYELMFFKLASGDYSGSGQGTTISIGGV